MATTIKGQALSIDTLLFLVIPRSPKTCSQTLFFQTFSKIFHIHFHFYHPWFSFLSQGYLPYQNSRVCLVMVFWSQNSLIDRQMKYNILTAKKSVFLCSCTQKFQTSKWQVIHSFIIRDFCKIICMSKNIHWAIVKNWCFCPNRSSTTLTYCRNLGESDK